MRSRWNHIIRKPPRIWLWCGTKRAPLELQTKLARALRRSRDVHAVFHRGIDCFLDRCSSAIAAIAFRARRRRLVVSSLLILSIFDLSRGCGFALYSLETGSKGRALAIVTGKEIEARLATADNANSVLALPPGSEIKF